MKGHIRQRGARSFELKFDAGRRDAEGKRVTEYRSFKGTKREAQIELAKLIAAVDKGTHVKRSTRTVAEHVEKRIERWKTLGAITSKTEERYRELYTNQIVPHLGTTLLQELKVDDIERWHAMLLSAGRKDGTGGLSTQTVRHAHRLLSKALKEAARHDLVIRNVASMQSAPKVQREEVIPLNAEQVRDVVSKLKGHIVYPHAILALFGGMRRAEILALRWQHIDLDTKVLKVCEAIEETKTGLRFKIPKSEAGARNISLPDILVEVLRDYRRQQLEQRLALGRGKLTGDTLLFARLDGGPQSPRLLSKQWAKAAATIGVDIHFHALRHTHASHLIDAGIDVVKISKRLGHSSPTVTLDTYAHLFARREDKSADAINEAVTALLST